MTSRRKTVLYWKKILREAGLDPTDIASLKVWRSKVKERMQHLTDWEKSKGHFWTGGMVLRNDVGANAKVFDCRVCGRVCKSKGGLVNHRRRTHEESSQKKKFECEKCKLVFNSGTQGLRAEESRESMRRCGGKHRGKS